MLLCLDCRRALAEGEVECRSCGSIAHAQVRDDGTVIEFMGDTDVPCAGCGVYGADLAFRRYRRVVGLAIVDRVHSLTGYFCPECRGHLFRRHQGLTLLLGWWGLLALFFRNPWAIAVNFKALWGPPRAAREYGATSLDELEERRRLTEAVAAGTMTDLWTCRVCGELFTGYERALKHADEVHTELRFDDAKAALAPVTADGQR